MSTLFDPNDPSFYKDPKASDHVDHFKRWTHWVSHTFYDGCYRYTDNPMSLLFKEGLSLPLALGGVVSMVEVRRKNHSFRYLEEG